VAAIGDLDGDGCTDLVVGYPDSFLWSGGIQFVSPIQVLATRWWGQIAQLTPEELEVRATR
jgi:hypothetical protein